MQKPKIALGFRPAMPEIKALSYVFTFGKYKGGKVEWVLDIDPGYLLWISDEKIAKVSETILNYAEEADTDHRLSEAMDGEFSDFDYWDFMGDDD